MIIIIPSLHEDGKVTSFLQSKPCTCWILHGSWEWCLEDLHRELLLDSQSSYSSPCTACMDPDKKIGILYEIQ